MATPPQANSFDAAGGVFSDARFKLTAFLEPRETVPP
jgi:hypothetical protein